MAMFQGPQQLDLVADFLHVIVRDVAKLHALNSHQLAGIEVECLEDFAECALAHHVAALVLERRTCSHWRVAAAAIRVEGTPDSVLVR